MISRQTNLVGRSEGEDVIVLDLETAVAHCLSGDTAAVWTATEAPTTVYAVATATELDTASVIAAVQALRDAGLLTDGASLTRRTVLGRALAAGGAVTAAGIVSMPLPAAARANSSSFSFAKVGCSFLSILNGPAMTFSISVTSGKLTPNTRYTVSYGYTSGTAILGIGGLTAWTSSSTVSAESFTFTTDANGLIAGSNTITHTTAQPYHGGMTAITISAGPNDSAVLTPPVSQTASC